jgi:membrane protein DedA with SNARE-associated domain
MWEWIHHLCGWTSGAIGLVAQNPEWSLVVAFLAAIIEALAIVGTVIPGTVIVMGVAGAAAAAGQKMLPFLAVAVAGAVIGDFLSYWVGYRFRFTVRQWWPLAQRPHLMAAADRFFAKYGSYSVALCRFIPVLRSTVPLVAGIAGMSRRRFLIANIGSALVWAPAHVCPAQLAGLSVDKLRAGDWQSAAVLGAGVLACAVLVWLLHRRLSPLLIAAGRSGPAATAFQPPGAP